MAGVNERGWLGMEADASREEVLVAAGIHRARGLIAAVGTDAENVFTVLTARVMRPDLFIIARVESEDAEHKLRRAGADRVISPYQIGATHMVQTALRPAVVDFVQLATSSERLDLSMEQVHISKASPLAEQRIVDAGIRQRFGVIIVGIKRADGAMEFNPATRSGHASRRRTRRAGRPESVKALEGGSRHDARACSTGRRSPAMQEEIGPDGRASRARTADRPASGIVLVGEIPASEVYVRNKLKAGADTGFRVDLERLPATRHAADVLALVER